MIMIGFDEEKGSIEVVLDVVEEAVVLGGWFFSLFFYFPSYLLCFTTSICLLMPITKVIS